MQAIQFSPLLAAAEQFAQGAAAVVYEKTGIRTGYAVKPTGIMGNFLFSFRVGEKLTSPSANVMASDDDLRQCGSPEVFIHGLARNILEQTKIPETMGAIQDARAAGVPEIPVIIDQQQRRHFRLVAETGYIGMKGNDRGDLQ